MVEVPVRHHDSRGARTLAEAVFRRTSDERCCSRKAGVDEGPSAITGVLHAMVHDIDEHQPLIADVSLDLVNAIVRALVGASAVAQGNLLIHFRPPAGLILLISSLEMESCSC